MTVIEKGFLSELNYFVLKFSTAESDCLTQKRLWFSRIKLQLLKNKNTLDGISDSYLKWRFITEVNGMKMQYTGACFTKHYSESTDLKKKFERNSPPMFRCVLGISWDDLPPVKGRKQNTVEFQKKNSYSDGPFTIYRVGGKGGGRLLRRVLGFKGGKLGDQSSLTELKGEDIKKLTDWRWEGRGELLGYYRALGGDQVNVIVAKKTLRPPQGNR